jgi:hypothetical protein
MAARDSQRKLFQALEAHIFDLEITRGVTSGSNQETLDRRIEAAQLLLEWLSQDLELDPASLAVPRHEKDPVGDVIASHRP